MLQFSVIGHRAIRLINFQDNTFKQIAQLRHDKVGLSLQRDESSPLKNLTCHCWISESIFLCGADDGSILIISNGVLLSDISYSEIDNSHAKDSGTNPSITALLPTSAGFVVGTSQGRCFYLERTPEGDAYRKVKETAAPDPSAVQSVAINSSEYQFVFSTMNGQIYVVKFETDPTGVSPVLFDSIETDFAARSKGDAKQLDRIFPHWCSHKCSYPYKEVSLVDGRYR